MKFSKIFIVVILETLFFNSSKTTYSLSIYLVRESKKCLLNNMTVLKIVKPKILKF